MERKQGIKSRANAHRQADKNSNTNSGVNFDPTIQPYIENKDIDIIDINNTIDNRNVYSDLNTSDSDNQYTVDNTENTLYGSRYWDGEIAQDESQEINQRSLPFEQMEEDYNIPMRSRSNTRRKKQQYRKIAAAVIVLLIMLGIVGTTIYIEKYGLSKEVMDVTEYYGTLTSDEMAIVLNDTILAERAIYSEGMQYLPYELINNQINPKVYWDYNEGLLLYSFPEYTEEYKIGNGIKPEGYESEILINVEDTIYISMEYISKYTDVEYQVFVQPNRIVLNTNWDTQQIVTANKNTQVRYRGGVKSEILTEVVKGEELILLSTGEEWHEVATKTGFVGYIQAKRVTQAVNNDRVSTFPEVVYSNISLEYPIVMGWHQTTNTTSNGNVNVILEGTKGLTTIAPTWFFIDDTAGNITSLASQTYVDYVHNQGIDVWATLNDFDGGIGSQVETYEVLSSTSKRKNIIDAVMHEVLTYNIDGINVDIELVSTSTGNHFIQFLRELSIECRANNIILSVDNYPPKVYNAHFEYEEQGEVVDYVIIMGYDEFHGGSKESGPVSSIAYVEDGLAQMVSMVQEEKIINAIPFYSRIWAEVPKTDYELEQQEGTDDAAYPYTLSTVTYTMGSAKVRVEESGASVVWDDLTKHNYATWEESPKIYKMWIEDQDSIREKLNVMKQYNLAGIAAWKLGIEEPEVWEEISNYVNN